MFHSITSKKPTLTLDTNDQKRPDLENILDPSLTNVTCTSIPPVSLYDMNSLCQSFCIAKDAEGCSSIHS